MTGYKFLYPVLILSALLSIQSAAAGLSSIRYVTAYEGLTFYQDKSQSSPVTAVIPYHTKVKVLEESKTGATISGKSGMKSGIWIRAKCKNKQNGSEYYEGWCFSGFLTDEEPETIYNVPMGAVAGTPLQLNVSYRNEATKVESEGDEISGGTSHYFAETVNFASDKKFEYNTSASHNYYRGESFSDNKDFTGVYTVEGPIVNIEIINSDEYENVWAESTSGREERLITILNGAYGGVNRLLTAETADKYLLIGPQGDVYSADKKGGKNK